MANILRTLPRLLNCSVEKSDDNETIITIFNLKIKYEKRRREQFFL